MRYWKAIIVLALALLTFPLGLATLVSGSEGNEARYFPIAYRAEPTPTPTPTATPTPSPTPTATPPPGTIVELRGLWVSRYDWTNQASELEAIVDSAAEAGFNAIFFQVRGEADAFYTPGLEPWSKRLTGTLGQDPGWDPLAHITKLAHERGLQLHAYLNTYPVWLTCDAPPDGTTPRHFYYDLRDHHGTTDGKLNGLQWNTADQVVCSATDYQRASPASTFVDDHLVAVANDLANRYEVDGVHLDHIRYAGSNTSCDPVSEASYGADCFTGSGYQDWQRSQVNGTVNRFYEDVALAHSHLWLSAAVWPFYMDYWNWGDVSQGYYDYYQDSKAWLAGGYIDSISPMIYPGSYVCPENRPPWMLDRWQTLVADFQAAANGRYVIPGIGSGYCSFSEIENRIEAARKLGTAGHAIFSYSGLDDLDYFDDLAAGPYAIPAVPPPIPWHP
ncbi:MAG: family 10 glycosylhydrolase [Chloroflexota bacterium]